jgi:indole-3-glycerol phosphate synthase/phosphoribosylanthranilate isomerase
MKRASPAKGGISPGLDAQAQARAYSSLGVRNVSVLTEEEYFKGSLADLRGAKAACPGLSLLRKDFLVSQEDVRVSREFGADAVLLIAAMLSEEELLEMRRCALSLGMRALVEVHSPDDVAKARRIGSDLTGINSRDLETLKIDPLLPVRIRSLIDWDSQVIYESGIRCASDAAFAGACGFDGMLVGESVTRDPAIIPSLSAAFSRAPRRPFWGKLLSGARTPLVKICGITNERDLLDAEAAGADLLGFVLAPSARQVEPDFLRGLGPSAKPRVAVLTCPPRETPPELIDLALGGKLDAFQFHDDTGPKEFRDSLSGSEVSRQAIPFYKAVRLKDSSLALPESEYCAARLLFDACSARAAGGTGTALAPELVEAAGAASAELWLAGGLGPDNVAQAVRRYRPGLVDASSGLEESPGRKDAAKMAKFVREAKNGR